MVFLTLTSAAVAPGTASAGFSSAMLHFLITSDGAQKDGKLLKKQRGRGENEREGVDYNTRSTSPDLGTERNAQKFVLGLYKTASFGHFFLSVYRFGTGKGA